MRRKKCTHLNGGSNEWASEFCNGLRIAVHNASKRRKAACTHLNGGSHEWASELGDGLGVVMHVHPVVHQGVEDDAAIERGLQRLLMRAAQAF